MWDDKNGYGCIPSAGECKSPAYELDSLSIPRSRDRPNNQWAGVSGTVSAGWTRGVHTGPTESQLVFFLPRCCTHTSTVCPSLCRSSRTQAGHTLSPQGFVMSSLSAPLVCSWGDFADNLPFLLTADSFFYHPVIFGTFICVIVHQAQIIGTLIFSFF